MLLQPSSEGTALKKGFPYLVLATPLFLGQFGFGLTGFSSLKPTGLVFLAYSPYWFQYYRGTIGHILLKTLN
jgi:hypothetical protein